jgi:ubiquinone biosynthesis protein Coq4
LAHATDIDKPPVVIPLSEAVLKLFLAIELTEAQAQDIVHGKRITSEANGIIAATWNSELLAVLEPVGTQLKSVVVFPEIFNA